MQEHIGFVHNDSEQPHSVDEKITDEGKVIFGQKKSNQKS